MRCFLLHWFLICAISLYFLKVVIQVVHSLDEIKVPAARAIVIWMMGEYSNLGEMLPRMVTTVLKYLAWSFPSEALETKLQILNTSVKVCQLTVSKKGKKETVVVFFFDSVMNLFSYYESSMYASHVFMIVAYNICKKKSGCTYIYIYIYLHMCACVCVCIYIYLFSILCNIYNT